MRYVKTSYFDKFKCAADKCPDTCCAGWQIMIDEAALEKYMRTAGTVGNRLVNGIDWREGCFLQYDRRCSMLNENNLCDLVTALGEEALCETCHRYPRHVEEFEGVREWSLSLSCPIAARIIAENEEPYRFVVEEDDTEDPLEDEFEDFDFLLFTKLEDARSVIFDILQNKSMTFDQRMRLLLELAAEMQACLDENRMYDMDNLIASYTKKEYDGGKDENTRFYKLREHFAVFYRLERLREEWGKVLDEAQIVLFASQEAYLEIRRAFLKEYGVGGDRHEQWQRFQENLIVFFLYTYFYGAVYDDFIYSKVALAVFSVSFIQEFIMCKWFLADKNIGLEEWAELAYRYAREVEHSDENLDILEEWLQNNLYDMKGIEH